MSFRPKSLLFAILAPVLFLAGCAPHNNNPIGKGYQNVTAKFNSYWIANQHIQNIEKQIAQQHENNFNKILEVLYPIDTAFTKGLETELEDAFKKASISIQRHPTSNWVYPSYVLIGKSRMYRGEYAEAIETFKFINTKSEEPDVRHEALINLMRVFVDYDERNNAVAVSDFLKKEKLNRKNLMNLYLTRAYMYHKYEDYDQMVNSLVQSVPLIKDHKHAAKIHFIIGQIYQEIGFDAEAYSNYRRCIRNNPDYELFFYARLNMAQVSDLSKESDVKKIRKYFVKLLEDPKNKEFRDKIYYEMGEFELKQDNITEAIEFYQASAGTRSQNNRQKAYSYLRLGQIYYERLKKYELAQAYYDSTISVLPKDEEEYEAIKERQEILDDFVEQINTIQLQDSLLTLASMDTATLNAYLDEYIEIERLKQEELERKRKKAAKKNRRNNQVSLENASNPFAVGDNLSGGSSTWYFYNTSAIAIGQNEFQRLWGGRPLEDHWRRSSKETASPRPAEQDLAVAGGNAGNENKEAASSQAEVSQGISRDALLSTIPFEEEEQQKAHELLENAFYTLGNIYHFNLYEDENSINSFEELIKRYPTTVYKPEVAYQLYLMYQQFDSTRSDYYKNMILKDFPRSNYARIITNPNYKQESNALSAKLQKSYKVAYGLYKQNYYDSAMYLVRSGLNDFPENEFTDNMKLLEILIIGETEGIHNYQYALEKFQETYPDSDLHDYAGQLLEASRTFAKEQARIRGANYLKSEADKFLFVLVYKQEAFKDDLSKTINDFINTEYSDMDLNTANLILNDSEAMILINEFESRVEAMQFYGHINLNTSPLSKYSSTNFNNFVITNNNFQILYQTKDLPGYLAFFEENFQ